VTALVLDDGNAEYTPGVSENRSSVTTYSHSGLKHMGAQTDAGTTPAVQATRTYDAFGGVQGSTGSWQGPFGTAGAFGYQSPQTGSEQGGLHLLGHRYYDASTGRFLTREPIGDGSNWYAYCENDPLALADPSGLAGVLIDGDSDFFAGWGDELTEIPLPGGSFSGTDWVRGQLGVNDVVNKDSEAYRWGRVIGFVNGLAKGIAKKTFKLGFDGAGAAAGAVSRSAQRRSTRTVIRDWENRTGRDWPKESAGPRAGKNQVAHHKEPLADGGKDEFENVDPMPYDDHIEHHQRNGDFRRWGGRR